MSIRTKMVPVFSVATTLTSPVDKSAGGPAAKTKPVEPTDRPDMLVGGFEV